MSKLPSGSLRFAMALAFTCLISLNARADEGVVEAFSSWQARGQIYPTGPDEATFVGVLSGVIYVKGSDGSLDAGVITCPGTIVINIEDNSQSANGKCAIITPETERIFAKFSCSGVYGKDCSGEFHLTGGTGTMEGISGDGPIQFMSAVEKLTTIPGNIVEQSTIGLAILPRLSYKRP